MTYFVADDYDWEEAPTFAKAVEMALVAAQTAREEVNVFEQIDWRRSLTDDERQADLARREAALTPSPGSPGVVQKGERT